MQSNDDAKSAGSELEHKSNREPRYPIGPDAPRSASQLGFDALHASTQDTFLYRTVSIFAYYFGLLFLDFLLVASLYSNSSSSTTEFHGLTTGAIFIGHTAFTTIVTTLICRNWLEGVLSCSVGILGILIAAFLPSLIEDGTPPDFFLTAVMIPAICLVSTLPIHVLRWWFGWRLVNRTDELPTPSRLSIEDMILTPAAVVALFVAAGLASAFSQSEMSILGTASWAASIPLMVICLVIFVPTIYWFFRGTDLGAGWAAACGYLIACSFAMILLAAILSNGNLTPEPLGWFVYFMAVSSLVA